MPTQTGPREHGWPQFADRLLELARGAEPGSDHQLAFVNALCASVLSTRHVVTLADLLDRDPAELGLTGLELDTDLRWRIVTALASAGDLDADGPATPFIDAEVQRDPTAAGKRHGAQAAAARPQPQVKEEAWTTVVEDDTLANITARSIIGGIAQPGQSELLQPFTARYFEVISRSLGAAIQRGRPDGGDRALPALGTSAKMALPPPTSSLTRRTPRCRRRCAGWCSKAKPE